MKADSSLVSVVHYSPNNSGKRVYPLTRVSVHCVVGQCSAETLGNLFGNASFEASSNYGVGYDGKIGQYVPESQRSWCTSSYDNDNRAITIEVASDTYDPYAVKDAAYKALIKLLVDICKRNKKKKLVWIADKAKALAYKPKSDELLMTVHRWFANKSCPGDYLYSRHGAIANEVNKQLGSSSSTTPSTPAKPSTPSTFKSYLVRVKISDLNIRKGPGTNYGRVGYIKPGAYTIVQESTGTGAKKWGKLNSGAGWIALDYCTKISQEANTVYYSLYPWYYHLFCFHRSRD